MSYPYAPLSSDCFPPNFSEQGIDLSPHPLVNQLLNTLDSSLQSKVKDLNPKLLERFLESASHLDFNTYPGQIYQKKGIKGLIHYLTSAHMIHLVTLPVDLGGGRQRFGGFFGHHACLVMTEGKRVYDMQASKKTTSFETIQEFMTQRQGEIANGLSLEIMALEHHSIMKNWTVFQNYRPFFNDCFTHLEKLLQAAELPTDLIIGRFSKQYLTSERVQVLGEEVLHLKHPVNIVIVQP